MTLAQARLKGLIATVGTAMEGTAAEAAVNEIARLERLAGDGALAAAQAQGKLLEHEADIRAARDDLEWVRAERVRMRARRSLLSHLGVWAQGIVYKVVRTWERPRT